MPNRPNAKDAKGIGEAVRPELQERWEAARQRIPDLLRQLDVPTDDISEALILFVRKTKNPDALVAQLRHELANEGTCAFITSSRSPDDDHMMLAVPAHNVSKKNIYHAPFVEIHSRLVAWWLTVAWRSAELARSTWMLGDQYAVISAAACARSLLETAAAFWCDARNLADMWSQIKLTGGTEASAWEDWRKMVVWLWMTTYGAKFDGRAPDLAKTWAHLPRANVLGQVEKLAKALPEHNLQAHYQWLCNTVHPSIGGTFAFSTPVMGHDSLTHAFVWYGPVATFIEGGGSSEAERTVQNAIVACATVSVEVMVRLLDDALKVIDDIGLTTRAPKMASFSYWRKTCVTTRKQLCPCRSQLRAEDCAHQWGESGPNVTKDFVT